MKKNEQYVGVNEKYVPEDEKYVDNNLNNAGKKGLKIAKGIVFGYLAFAIIVIVMVIVVFILVFSQFFKINKQGDEIKDKANNIINQGINNVDSFNFDIEAYSGTQYGSTVSRLLDNVITKIKKNTNHQITVIYGTTTTSKTDEITTLKKQFDMATQYEVSLDYDSNGYINKVTITNY